MRRSLLWSCDESGWFFSIAGGEPDPSTPFFTCSEILIVLTEATVERMFREIVNTPKPSEETFDQAEDLLEAELRDESPLRHRLSVELDELRSLATK